MNVLFLFQKVWEIILFVSFNKSLGPFIKRNLWKKILLIAKN